MFYKLANNFSVNDIEAMQSLKFKFPDAFESKPIIDGLNEEILPVVTNSQPDVVDFAIWGLLPQNFKDDWSVFQNTGNTLNMSVASVLESEIYNEVLSQRRCCILVSGFFASYYFDGEVFPVYVYSENHKFFALAGIYNVTDDGFITTTLLLRRANPHMTRLHNVSNRMPLVLGSENMHQWLNNGYSTIACDEVDDFNNLNMKSHTIAKEFYKNNIVFDSILNPVEYKNLSFNF